MSGAAQVLDDEFVFLASLVNPVYAALPEHRDEVRLWLERLFLTPTLVDSARRDRNEYLSRLYHGMMSGRLDAVFLDEPPEGALRPPEDVFPALSATAWLDDVEAGVGAAQPAKPQGCGDADDRTYLATQVLPDGRGAFGYLAVSLAPTGPHWDGAAQGPRATPGWGPKEPLASSTPLEASPASVAEQGRVHEREPAGLRQPQGPGGVLEGRAPAEQRQQLLQFYDSLIGDLDQALREPARPNPELEKLVGSLKDSSAASLEPDSDTSGASSHQAELLARLRERLVGRRTRAEQRSLALDALELEESLAETSLPLEPSARAPRSDQDDVWNIKPENVALLSAAYPRELVQRFLDGVVRERVAVLGRVRSRRYFHQHVEGLEDNAAEDMEHYRDGTEAWAGVLQKYEGAPSVRRSAEDAARQAARCAELADKGMAMMRELGASRREYFDQEEQQKGVQERLRADIELLRAEEAVLKRRLHQMLARADK